MTLRELAIEAMAVQDACNLSGVAQSFARVMRDLGEHTDGTHERNTHPIARVWIDKMASLAGMAGADPTVLHAYDLVHKLAEG